MTWASASQSRRTAFAVLRILGWARVGRRGSHRVRNRRPVTGSGVARHRPGRTCQRHPASRTFRRAGTPAPASDRKWFLKPGDLVVLTGDMSQPRNSIESAWPQPVQIPWSHYEEGKLFVRRILKSSRQGAQSQGLRDSGGGRGLFMSHVLTR